MVRKAIPLAVLALLLVTSAVLANGLPAIERDAIVGGGGQFETGPYVLDATLGQAVTGQHSQATFQLCSGFRCRAMHTHFLPLTLREFP
jgi:hypothetical protein